MGGSADLAPSNMTLVKSSGDFQKDSYENRNFRHVAYLAPSSVLSSSRNLLAGLCPSDIQQNLHDMGTYKPM